VLRLVAPSHLLKSVCPKPLLFSSVLPSVSWLSCVCTVGGWLICFNESMTISSVLPSKQPAENRLRPYNCSYSVALSLMPMQHVAPLHFWLYGVCLSGDIGRLYGAQQLVEPMVCGRLIIEFSILPAYIITSTRCIFPRVIKEDEAYVRNTAGNSTGIYGLEMVAD